MTNIIHAREYATSVHNSQGNMETKICLSSLRFTFSTLLVPQKSPLYPLPCHIAVTSVLNHVKNPLVSVVSPYMYTSAYTSQLSCACLEAAHKGSHTSALFSVTCFSHSGYFEVIHVGASSCGSLILAPMVRAHSGCMGLEVIPSGGSF